MTQYVVADDLTGASDAGVQFAKRGARTVVWLDYEHVGDVDADVLVVDTDSRHETPDGAYTRMAELLRYLRPRRAHDVVKKMDSTLRGNAGPEVRALLEAFPTAFAIVAPAYPKNGRTSRDGIVYVYDERVDETDFGRDLFSPVRDAGIAEHLGEPCALFDRETLHGGTDEIGRAIDTARAHGMRIGVFDAETDDDLRALAALDVHREDILWVGSAGIVEMLERGPANTPPTPPAVNGPVLFLIGSLSEMTQLQVAAFARQGVARTLDPCQLLRGGSRAQLAIAGVREALRGGDDALLALNGDREAVEATLALGAERGWDARTTSARLREAFLIATGPLVHERGGGATFVLSGGDLARSFCAAHGIRGMELLAETAPGVPLSRAIGANMYLVTKAGGFGRPETYVDILSALRRKVTA
jgi:uncharacterized protein YgbK (DUF1537 family)